MSEYLGISDRDSVGLTASKARAVVRVKRTRPVTNLVIVEVPRRHAERSGAGTFPSIRTAM